MFERVTDFTFPAFHGTGPVSRKRLDGSVVVLALAGNSPADARPMAEFDSLKRRFGKVERVQFVVLSKFAVARDDDEMLPPAIERADLAAEASAMLPLFGHPQLDATPEIDFKLPSFLLLDERGRVIRRVQGLPYAVFAPALDSIDRLEQATPRLRDAALADSMRAPIAAALARVDLNSMYDPDGVVRYDPCRLPAKPKAALIPAAIRLLDLQATGRELTARLEVISVGTASVDSAEHASACFAKRLNVNPVVTTDTIDARLRPAGNWWVLDDMTPSVLLVSRLGGRYNFEYSFGGPYTLMRSADSVRAALGKDR